MHTASHLMILHLVCQVSFEVPVKTRQFPSNPYLRRYNSPAYYFDDNNRSYHSNQNVSPNQRFLSNQFPSLSSSYQWGTWSTWSVCSAVCDGGVRNRIRKCERIDGYSENEIRDEKKNDLMCEHGNNMEYQPCNKQVCWSKKEVKKQKYESRRKQCYHQRAVPFGGKMYEWLPYMRAGLNECYLNCVPTGLRIFKSFGKVVDGTVCGEQQGYTCQDGQCKKYKGDITNQHVANKFSETDSATASNTSSISTAIPRKIVRIHKAKQTDTVGYKFAFLIPKGASNISLWKLQPSRNLIALKQRNVYILNGHWKLSPSRKFPFGKLSISYLVKEKDKKFEEQLFIDGPLLDHITVEILYQQDSHEIKYSYNWIESSTQKYFMKDYPLRKHFKPAPLHYKPAIKQYKPATLQVLSNRIIPSRLITNSVPRNRHQQLPSESNIFSPQQPIISKSVNHIYRPPKQHFQSILSTDELNEGHTKQRMIYKWQIGGITKCTRKCNAGEQAFIYKCFQMVNAQSGKFVNDHLCKHLQKPTTRKRVCNAQPCPARWAVGVWSKCSHTCGNSSVQTRPVVCKERRNENFTNTEIVVNDRNCFKLKKPDLVRQCSVIQCYFEWKSEPWGECSSSCDKGLQIRNVYCVHHYGYRLSKTKCDPMKRPADMRECFRAHCDVSWMVSEWGKCSSLCGRGVQERKVICMNKYGRKLSDKHCGEQKETKPKNKQTCDGNHCAFWTFSHWSECSTECGIGTRKRHVFCVQIDDQDRISHMNSRHCSEKTKPVTMETCKGDNCHGDWFVSQWDKCDASCGEGGTSTRRSFCLDNKFQPSRNCSLKKQPIRYKKCQQSCTPTSLNHALISTEPPAKLLVTKTKAHSSHKTEVAPNDKNIYSEEFISGTTKKGLEMKLLVTSPPKKTPTTSLTLPHVRRTTTTRQKKTYYSRSKTTILHQTTKILHPTTKILHPTKPSTTSNKSSTQNIKKINSKKNSQKTSRQQQSDRRNILRKFPFAKLSKTRCFLDLQSKAYCNIIAYKLRFCNVRRFYVLCCKSCDRSNSR